MPQTEESASEYSDKIPFQKFVPEICGKSLQF